MLNKAIDIAHRAHEGQKRKYSGLPYIVHPLEVLTTLIQNGVTDQTILSAAVLHDVLEDCEGYKKEIKALSGAVYYIVKALTKGSEDFSSYEVQLIKTADIASNTRDSSNRSYLRKKLQQLETFNLVNKHFFFIKTRGHIQIALGDCYE